MEQKLQEERFSRVLPQVVKTVRASTALAAQDVRFYKSIDKNLSDEIDETSDKLMEVANKLMGSISDSSTEIKIRKDRTITDSSWKNISNVLDSIFEKVDIAIDRAKSLSSSKSGEAPQKEFTYLEDSHINNDSKALRNKVVDKPQEQFKESIDNSETHPFKPKLKSKPYALKSFEESTRLIMPNLDANIDEKDPAHYPQPYEYEIENQDYPAFVLEMRGPIEPQPWLGTSEIWVDNLEALKEMVNELSSEREIAIDLEHHDYRSYYGLVCLMQISSRTKDWIIDTLVLRDELQVLNKVFANPSILKVLHGAFMDIIWLQRDLGLYIVSLFDTYHASKKLGFPRFSLAYLLETFAHFKTSKKYQLADWRTRPLLRAMLAYARSDTHFLLYIYDQMRNKLLLENEHKMKEVLYESRQVAKRRFEYTKYRPVSPNNRVSCPIMSNNPKEPFKPIMIQYNIPLHKQNLVEVLYNWRDDIARKQDESVRYIMPNQLLVSLASLERPVTVQNVLNASSYVPEYVRLNAQGLASVIDETLKKMADHDWKLVDEWSSQNNGYENQNVVNHAQVLDYNSTFKQLIDSGNESSLLKNNIIISKSKVSEFINLKRRFSVEIDLQNKEKINHTLEEAYVKRFTFLQNALSVNKITLEQETEQASPNDSFAIEADDRKLEDKNIIQSLPAIDDPEEIITIRKKSRNTKLPKKENLSDSRPLNYETSENIMLDVNKKHRRSIKRSFDPNESKHEAIKPAKKTKKTNSGRTATFRQGRS